MPSRLLLFPLRFCMCRVFIVILLFSSISFLFPFSCHGLPFILPSVTGEPLGISVSRDEADQTGATRQHSKSRHDESSINNVSRHATNDSGCLLFPGTFPRIDFMLLSILCFLKISFVVLRISESASVLRYLFLYLFIPFLGHYFYFLRFCLILSLHFSTTESPTI